MSRFAATWLGEVATGGRSDALRKVAIEVPIGVRLEVPAHLLTVVA